MTKADTEKQRKIWGRTVAYNVALNALAAQLQMRGTDGPIDDGIKELLLKLSKKQEADYAAIRKLQADAKLAA